MLVEINAGENCFWEKETVMQLRGITDLQKRKLVSEGYDTIGKLNQAGSKDLRKIKGFADKIVRNIKYSLRMYFKDKRIPFKERLVQKQKVHPNVKAKPKEYYKKFVKTYKEMGLEEKGRKEFWTSQEFLIWYLVTNEIKTIEGIENKGIIPKVVRNDEICKYSKKKELLEELHCDVNIIDECGFQYIVDKQMRNELRDSYVLEMIESGWTDEIKGDYKFHYIIGAYYDGFSLWRYLMEAHNYNFYNKALEIASKKYELNKDILKHFIDQRIQDGKDYKRRNKGYEN